MSTTPPPISVQLYSLREAAAVDFAAVIRRVGEIGFVGVELAGFNGMEPATFAGIAAEAGLVVSSAHINDLSPDALNASLDALQEVGCQTVALAFLAPEKFATRSAVDECADLVNAANVLVTSRGASLGYHNHWWEFEQRFDDVMAWDYFFSRLEPTVFAELDTYWATVGGVDPVQLTTTHGARIPLLHVKDGPADNAKSDMVAVGSGAVAVPRILQGAPHATWHVVELDRCATDMFTAIEDSYRFLTTNGLSTGRV